MDTKFFLTFQAGHSLVTDLFSDLKDGTLLLSLLEVLSGKAMVGQGHS